MKTCPFCGNSNLNTYAACRTIDSSGNKKGPDKWFVVCQTCNSQGPAGLTSKIAEILWNNRTEAFL